MEVPDVRANNLPEVDINRLLGYSGERPRVQVSEFPGDEKKAWSRTRNATIARKKAALRAKPTLRKKVSFLEKKKDGEASYTLYILAGVGALVAATCLMK